MTLCIIAVQDGGRLSALIAMNWLGCWSDAHGMPITIERLLKQWRINRLIYCTVPSFNTLSTHRNSYNRKQRYREQEMDGKYSYSVLWSISIAWLRFNVSYCKSAGDANMRCNTAHQPTFSFLLSRWQSESTMNEWVNEWVGVDGWANEREPKSTSSG